MKLEDIELHGLGRFTHERCGFRIERYHLEKSWSYLYATRKIVLRVDQRGPEYIQAEPPSGVVILRRERFQTVPSLFVWTKTPEGRAFTNFYHPVVGFDGLSEPEEFCCEFTPEKATYRVKLNSLSWHTELFVPSDEAVVVANFCIRNDDSHPRKLEIIPVMRPHFASASLAPWDVPALYQSVSYRRESCHRFEIQLRSPAGDPGAREHGFVLSDMDSPDGIALDYAEFIGRGTFERPEVLAGKSPGKAERLIGKQAVIALLKPLQLAPGEHFRFSFILGATEDVQSPESFLIPAYQERAICQVRESVGDFLNKRRIRTPDEALNRYVNEFLPLQLRWVRLLDRGWPTGMRGTRDCAQDTTALVPLDPKSCRETIIELFSIQNSNGWFPRQYSISGRHGNHDLREYVDGGIWVWELLFDYLCYTKDLSLLFERTPYLDKDDMSTVLEHAVRIFDYYLNNLAEHGLCLIREGDWNDSVNRAGLEGRGESTMVSCQLVLALRQMSYLLEGLQKSPVILGPALEQHGSLANLTAHFRIHADAIKANILSHALNKNGFLNGVFTDNGEWVFSPCDPDGKCRINVPVNSFGIISGVLEGEHLRNALNILKGLKKRDGWPLFDPPIGEPPIKKLGRIGEGDLAPGLGENGTVYNHGSHGFLGRAAACAGDGNMLYEVMRYMLPYDQAAHPVERSKTPPYAMVNHWKTASGMEGEGGDLFLTGSISTALRNAYGGMLGIKPSLDSLVIDPCLPDDWEFASADFRYLGAEVTLTCLRATDCCEPTVRINDQEYDFIQVDPTTGRKHVVIPDSLFEGQSKFEIVIKASAFPTWHN